MLLCTTAADVGAQPLWRDLTPDEQAEQRAENELRDRVRDRFRDWMQQCWRMPAGEGSDRLVVTIVFQLSEDGTIVGEPRVVSPRGWRRDREMRSAAEEALRAVTTCSPYNLRDDAVLAEHYDLWREVEVTFRPVRE